MLRDSQGREFVVQLILTDGVRCSDESCGRVIRVREKASVYPVLAPRRDDGVLAPTGKTFHRCRDCLYREPINDYNRIWRKDATP